MASPRRVYTIYQQLAQDAETVKEFQLAQGENVSGTVTLLLSGNREKLLQRWGEEMASTPHNSAMPQRCSNFSRLLDDFFSPRATIRVYLMECTQCFYC